MSTKRRGRLVMWASLVAAVAVIVWGSSYGPGYIKVRVYSRRIERGINPHGNLEALAEVGHPAAIGILEKYAMRPELGLGTSQAITLLCRHFPDSMMPRGVGEWEEIVGRPYGLGRRTRESGRSAPVSNSVDRLREWLDDYPVHPGRDDVYLRLENPSSVAHQHRRLRRS